MKPYIPDLNIEYPDKPDQHMIEIIPTHETVVDEKYPFIDRSFKFWFMRRLMYLGIIVLIFFFLIPLRYGLKIEGRKNLRKHRKLLKNGVMSVSNHIHRWDFLFVLKSLRYRMMYFPALKDNFNSDDEGFIRLAGGIPVPESISAFKFFNKAFDEVHAKKKWIHAYPESAMFPYYYPIRPFKKGVFTLARRYNLPVLPLAFSYRKAHFPFTFINLLRSIFGYKKLPMVTVRIGDPILPDASLSKIESVKKLRTETHKAIIRLAGVIDNPFPAEGD
ncbi:MAG: 1-acyl-sn-glycerol-3-phosphate acyltransferase [Treponema sp.]|nr:1-acyl-sn-glycerol-3-phosphate acyltransferase [Treponema sp.]